MSIKKILVVDDVDFSREQVSSLLKRTNCRVLNASNGEEALAVARNEVPALILMDLNMPVMNGDDCCRKIKSDPSLKSIPVIMTISSKEEKESKRCVDAGCDDIVARPIIKVEGFFEKIKKFVDIAVREHARVLINTAVSYYIGSEEYSAMLHDISEGGVFIKTVPIPEVTINTTINLIFTLPGSVNLIEAEGKIVRIIKKSATSQSTLEGIGVQFVRLTLDGKRAIEGYVKAMG